MGWLAALHQAKSPKSLFVCEEGAESLVRVGVILR